MKLQEYTLSKMCHDRDAALHAITRLKPSHFTGSFRNLFIIIQSIYKMNGVVDLHVLASQAHAQGLKESRVTEIYNYCIQQTDDWQNVFSEFKQSAIRDTAISDFQELLDKAHSGTPLSELSSLTTSKALAWMGETDKRYYSGKEIDELDEEFGEPIKTGYPLYDEQVYKYGGNQKGQMKAVIMREKHGKTRSECWECAQNLRMGYKILYVTLEGRKQDITGNIKQVLREQWREYRQQLFVVDGVVDIKEIESVVLEAVLIEGVDKVVIDYAQLQLASGDNENSRINTAVEVMRNLMVKHNFHLVELSQARKESTYTSTPKDSQGNKLVPDGWKHVPTPNDMYGSNALIKAATLIITGYRPALYSENVKVNEMGKKVLNPQGWEDPVSSLYMNIVRTRYKPEFLHRWWRFTDTDNGLQNPEWI